MAEAEEPAAAPAPAAVSEKRIQHPFDPATHDCVLDVRALCRLPANADEDGVHALRALILEKGKTVHVPDEPGRYATSAPHRTQTALCLVHFSPETKRADELMLSFVDYGMLSSQATGVYVESLQLPLQKARNIYEETPRFTTIKDVCGFTNINAKSQPWCTLLKPAIERQQMLASIEVFNSLDVIQLLRKPLRVRLKQLETNGREAIAKMVEDLARQDKRAAERQKGTFESRFAATLKFFQDLQPNKYDIPMSQRILEVKGGMDGVQWLNTPLRAKIDGGTAQLVATNRRPPVVRLDLGETVVPPASGAKDGGEQEGEGADEFADPSDDGAVEDPGEEESKAPEQAPPSAKERAGAKRARQPPVRLDADPATGASRKGKGKKSARQEVRCNCHCCHSLPHLTA